MASTTRGAREVDALCAFVERAAPKLASELGQCFGHPPMQVSMLDVKVLGPQQARESEASRTASNWVSAPHPIGQFIFGWNEDYVAQSLLHMFDANLEDTDGSDGSANSGCGAILRDRLTCIVSTAFGGDHGGTNQVRSGTLHSLHPEAADFAFGDGADSWLTAALDLADDDGDILHLFVAWRRPVSDLSFFRPSRTDEAKASKHETGLSIPLRIDATLGTMNWPASRLAELKPGFVFPMALPASVPLSIGGRDIAAGVAGEKDGRVAIHVNRVLLENEDHLNVRR